MTTNDVAKVFDTILSTPGMNEMMKIDLRISRKNVLLLDHLIESGLNTPDDEKSSILISAIPEENLKDLRQLAEDCLQKAGLTELREKMMNIGKSEK